MVSCYRPKFGVISAGVISAMNPKKLLPILLWISQIPLPSEEYANDFAHWQELVTFVCGLNDQPLFIPQSSFEVE